MRVWAPAMASAVLASLVIAVVIALVSSSGPCELGHHRHKRTTPAESSRPTGGPPGEEVMVTGDQTNPVPAELTPPAAFQTVQPGPEGPEPTAQSVEAISVQDAGLQTALPPDQRSVQVSVQPNDDGVLSVTSPDGSEQQSVLLPVSAPPQTSDGLLSPTPQPGAATVSRAEVPSEWVSADPDGDAAGASTQELFPSSSPDQEASLNHLDSLHPEDRLQDGVTWPSSQAREDVLLPSRLAHSAPSASRAAKLQEERTRRLGKIQRDILELKQWRLRNHKPAPGPTDVSGLHSKQQLPDTEPDLVLERKPQRSMAEAQQDREELDLDERPQGNRGKGHLERGADYLDLEERPQRGRGRGKASDREADLDDKPRRDSSKRQVGADRSAGRQVDPALDSRQPDSRQPDSKQPDRRQPNSSRDGYKSSKSHGPPTVASKKDSRPPGDRKKGRHQEPDRRGERRSTGKRVRQDPEDLLEDNALSDESWDNTGSSESDENSLENSGE